MTLRPERCPALLEANKSLVARDFEDLINVAIEKLSLKNGDVILTDGCASVYLEHLIPVAEKMNLTIYGIDNSEAMVQFTKKSFDHPSVKHIHGLLTSEDSPLKDMKFDRVFSIYHFQFLSLDYKKELKVVYNLMNQGGELFFVLFQSPLLFGLFKTILDLVDAGEHAKEHVRSMNWVTDVLNNPDAFKDDVRKLGFTVQDLTIEKKSYHFERIGIYADLLLAYNSFVHYFHEEKFNAIRSAYINYFRNTPSDVHTPSPDLTEDSPYTIEYQTITILLSNSK